MSAATATLIAGGLAVVGTLLGVVVGLVVEDRLRRRGEVRREVRAWVGGQTGGISESRVFEVRFFNDRDVNISLWDVKVEFYDGKELIASLPPKESAGTSPPVGPVDLPSRRSVFITMMVEADSELLEKLRRSDRSTLVATVTPGGKKVSNALRAWDPMYPPGTW